MAFNRVPLLDKCIRSVRTVGNLHAFSRSLSSGNPAMPHRPSELQQFPWFQTNRQKVPVVNVIPDLLAYDENSSYSGVTSLTSEGTSGDFIDFRNINMEDLFQVSCSRLQQLGTKFDEIMESVSNGQEISFNNSVAPLLAIRFEIIDLLNVGHHIASYLGHRKMYRNVGDDITFGALGSSQVNDFLRSRFLQQQMIFYEDEGYHRILDEVQSDASLTPTQRYIVQEELQLCQLMMFRDKSTAELRTSSSTAKKVQQLLHKLQLMQYYFDIRVAITQRRNSQTISNLEHLKHASPEFLKATQITPTRWSFPIIPEFADEFLKVCSFQPSREYMWLMTNQACGQKMYSFERLSNHFLIFNVRKKSEYLASLLGYPSMLSYKLVQSGLSDVGIDTDQVAVDLIDSIKTVHDARYRRLISEVQEFAASNDGLDQIKALQPWDVPFWTARFQETKGLPLRIPVKTFRGRVLSLIDSLFGIKASEDASLSSRVQELSPHPSEAFALDCAESGRRLGHFVWMSPSPDMHCRFHDLMALGAHRHRFLPVNSTVPTFYHWEKQDELVVTLDQDCLRVLLAPFSNLLLGLTGAPCLLPSMNTFTPSLDKQPNSLFLGHFLTSLVLSPTVLRHLLYGDQLVDQTSLDILHDLSLSLYSKEVMRSLFIAAFDCQMWRTLDNFRDVHDQLWKNFFPYPTHKDDEWPCSAGYIFGLDHGHIPCVAQPLAALSALDAVRAFQKDGLSRSLSDARSVGLHFRNTFLNPQNVNTFAETFRLFRGRDVLTKCPSSYVEKLV